MVQGMFWSLKKYWSHWYSSIDTIQRAGLVAVISFDLSLVTANNGLSFRDCLSLLNNESLVFLQECLALSSGQGKWHARPHGNKFVERCFYLSATNSISFLYFV